MPTYKAASYIRLSYTNSRASESDSISNQRKLIEDFVKDNPDIEIVTEKVDDGYSGIIFDRPAFQGMMREISNGHINCVIVKDLSRLGREYIETGRYLRRIFPAHGVRFIAITDHIDTLQDSGDDLIVSVKNIMNEAYSRDISIKTRAALDTKRRHGDFVSAFPMYGYMKAKDNHNQLVPDPCVASVVQDIFRMRLEGYSILQIAAELNALNIPSPLAYKRAYGLSHAKKGYADHEDCQWSATTIIRILQDETYTGTLVQGKHETPHYKIRKAEKKPSSEWIRIPDAHESLVDKYDFALVQHLWALDTRTAPMEKCPYLFSGILICDCCGRHMTRKTNRMGSRVYHYYVCPTGKKNGCCSPVMLQEGKLVEYVKSNLNTYIDSVVNLESRLSGINQTSLTLALLKKHRARIAENEQQLEKTLALKDSLDGSLSEGVISHEEYVLYRARYIKRVNAIKADLQDLKEKMILVQEQRGMDNRWMTIFKKFTNINHLDRKIIIHTIRQIRVKGKYELDISFTFEDEYKEALELVNLAEQVESTSSS